MMLYVLLLLVGSASVYACEDSNAVPKSVLELIISGILNNYFQELSNVDPFYIEHASNTVSNRSVEIFNLTSEGFSNVQVLHVRTWGPRFSKHISLQLKAPKITSTIGRYVVTGPIATIHGSSSLQLEDLSTSIKATANLIKRKIKRFKASFHLQHANASIVAIRNDENYSQNATDSVNDYLNYSFNTDYKLHQKMADYLRRLLVQLW